jgi:hypothetical protein
MAFFLRITRLKTARAPLVIIPADDGQGFQSIVDSDSRGRWTGLWPDRGQIAE